MRVCRSKNKSIPSEVVHGELGALAELGGKVQCHVCGSYFHHLGGHVKEGHELEASEYRAKYGLQPTTGLISSALANKRRLKMSAKMDGKVGQELLRRRTPEQRSADKKNKKKSLQLLRKMRGRKCVVKNFHTRILTVEDVKLIRREWRRGSDTKALAKRFSVSYSKMLSAARGENFKRILDPPPLTSEEIRDIRRRFPPKIRRFTNPRPCRRCGLVVTAREEARGHGSCQPKRQKEKQ